MQPRFPIYIPSKGRADTRLTVKALDNMSVPYKVVVEAQEFDDYASVIDEKLLLVLPFSDKGLHKTRNWIWDHAIESGYEMHWQLDDNIDGFVRLHKNRKIKVVTGTIFYVIEEFVSRYENIAQAGMNYRFLGGDQRAQCPAVYFNTRIYSCTLLRNDIPFRYRSFFNDDTDLSLQVLKAGWCTVLFQAFMANKRATMSVKGGLTEHYTTDNGRRKMAEALLDLHPDVTTIKQKWGRDQHVVDYSEFKYNKLIRKDDVDFPEGTNNFGLVLQQLVDEQWVDVEDNVEDDGT